MNFSSHTTRLYSVFDVLTLQGILVVSDPEWRGMIATSLCMGLRLADIGHLLKEDIDSRISRLRVGIPKSRQELDLPIIQPLRPYLEPLLHLCEPQDPVFQHAFKVLASSGGGTVRLRAEFRKLQFRARGLSASGDQTSAVAEQDSITFQARSFGALRKTLQKLLMEMPVEGMAALAHVSECIVSPRPQRTHPLEAPWLIDRLSSFLSV